MILDVALRMQPDGFDALMQLMEEAGCRIKRGAHVSIKPPGGQRFIRLGSLGAEYSEAALRSAIGGQHVHISRIPRGDYTAIQIRRLIDIEAKLREGKDRGFQIWAERNNIDAVAQSVIFLKEHQIGSIEELQGELQSLRAERNSLHAAIRQSKSRMDEINHLRQAIRDYRRTNDVYWQYRESGWSSRFYSKHRDEISSTGFTTSNSYDLTLNEVWHLGQCISFSPPPRAVRISTLHFGQGSICNATAFHNCQLSWETNAGSCSPIQIPLQLHRVSCQCPPASIVQHSNCTGLMSIFKAVTDRCDNHFRYATTGSFSLPPK